MGGIRKLTFGKIGANTRILYGSTYYNTKNIYIEENVFIGTKTYMDAILPIRIGSGVMIGPRCTFISGNHNYKSDDLQAIPYDNRMKYSEIIIENNVWLGANVMVCPGTHVGEGAIIGAGCCIWGNIPSFSVIGVQPFRVIGERNIEIYNKLKNNDSIYNTKFAGKGFEII